jgi:hypothetical protein
MRRHPRRVFLFIWQAHFRRGAARMQAAAEQDVALPNAAYTRPVFVKSN